MVWIALIHHKTYTKFVQDLFQAKKFKFGANMASYFNGDYGENQNFIARLKSSLMWLILIQAYIYKPCKPHSEPRKKGECAQTARGKVQNLSKKSERSKAVLQTFSDPSKHVAFFLATPWSQSNHKRVLRSTTKRCKLSQTHPCTRNHVSPFLHFFWKIIAYSYSMPNFQCNCYIQFHF